MTGDNKETVKGGAPLHTSDSLVTCVDQIQLSLVATLRD